MRIETTLIETTLTSSPPILQEGDVLLLDGCVVALWCQVDVEKFVPISIAGNRWTERPFPVNMSLEELSEELGVSVQLATAARLDVSF